MEAYSKSKTDRTRNIYLASRIKWRIAILFMIGAYFPIFGQNSIDSKSNDTIRHKVVLETTSSKYEEYATKTAPLQSYSDKQNEFNVCLKSFVDSCMNDPNHLTRSTDQTHTCSTLKPVDIANLAEEEARNQFILQNLEAYKHLFISSSRSMTIPDVCDNGGFEDDFLYYEGFISTYSFGSDSCTPHDSSGPSTFIPASLPTTNRFEIVTSGTDPLVGINRTKFDDKALRINNRTGHLTNCNGDFGVDKNY